MTSERSTNDTPRVICHRADRDRPTVVPVVVRDDVNYCAACGADDHEPYVPAPVADVAPDAAT